jgi:hypothetical protein
VTITELDSETLGAKTFEGNNTIGVHTKVTSTVGSLSTSFENTTYERFDGLEFRLFGVETFLPATATTPSQGRKITYTPPYLAVNAALLPGQSYAQTYTQTMVRTDLVPAPPPQTISNNETNTFVGFDTVTVPAGTFVDACKWQRGSDLTYWNARGSGIFLKAVRTVTPMIEDVLESATRDGVPLTP